MTVSSPQIRQLTKLISDISNGDINKVAKECAELSLDLGKNNELNEIREEILKLAQKHLEANEFIINLAKGNLYVEAPKKNRLVDPYKELQANLRHLVWQTQEIARGDYSQHVDFLGDFSNSFNALVKALQEKSTLEEALKSSEEKYRDIFENSIEGIFQSTLDGKLLNVNPAYAQVFGYNSPQEMISRVNCIETELYFRPEDRQLLIKKLYKDGVVRNMELRFRKKDGSLFWVLSNSRMVRNANGEPLYLEGTMVDITSRKQAEEVVNLSEGRLKRAELASLSGNWELHTDTGIIIASDGARTIYELDKEQIDYSVIKTIPLPEYRPMLNEAMKNLLEKNVPYNVEFKIQTVDTGTVKDIQSKAIFDGENRIVFGVIQDITERKRMENSLQESQARLKTLVQTIPDLIWLKDKDGVYLSCNNMFERFFGAPESEIVGKTDYDFVEPELADFFRKNDLKAIQAGGPTENEEWITFADDGHMALLDTIKTPMFSSSGLLIGVLGVARDITERKQIEKALEESEKKFRSLFNEMSEGFAFHEIVYNEDQKATDYRILNVNSAFEKLIGIKAENAMGILSTKLYGVEEAPYLDTYSQVAQTGEHQSFQVYFPPLDRYFQISAFSPNPGFFATVFTDITEQKLSRMALEESERRFRDMMEHVNMVSAMLDIHGNITFANDYLLKLTGWKQEEVLGQNWFDVFIPSGAAVRNDLFKDIELEKVPVHYENEILTRSGELRLIEWSNSILRNSKGEIVGLAGIGVDITDRKNAENALWETKNYLENLINYANAPIIVWNNAFKIKQFNKAFERLTGRVASEVLEKEVKILFPASTRAQSLEYIKKATSGERWEVVEIEIQDLSGNIHTLLWNSAAIYSPDGKTVMATIAQGQDITLRKQSEAENEKTQKLLEDSQRIGKIGGWEMNLDTMELNWTKEMYNIHEVDLSFKPKVDLRASFYTPESVPLIDKAVREAIEQGGSYDIDVEIITAKGNHRSIRTIGKVDLKSRRMIGFFQDITERKMAENELKASEAQLRELNATKDKFFSIIAHDLKSPFNSILGLSSLLEERVGEKNYEDIGEFATLIRSSSELAYDLLKNLLEWSRSQTGKMEFSREYLDLVGLIDDAFHLMENSARQKSIVITRHLPRNMLAFADRAMIATILRNLISNAIKFTKPGGEIIISAQQTSTEIKVAISDNGVGIRKEELSKLFRIDENHSTLGTLNEKGTGLGLILCKEFIEKHGGRIWAESEFGKGSQFYFVISKI